MLTPTQKELLSSIENLQMRSKKKKVIEEEEDEDEDGDTSEANLLHVG